MAKREKGELNVQGMTCRSCALHVEKALKDVTGVQEASVPGWESGRAEVTTESDVTDEELAAAVRSAGYKARVESRTLLQSPSTGDGRGDGEVDLMVIGGGSAGPISLSRLLALINSETTAAAVHFDNTRLYATILFSYI